MQRLCNNIKLRWEEKHRKETKEERISGYDGKIQPDYRRYPNNAQVCHGLKSPRWNPPVWAVERWIEMCMEKRNTSAIPGRVICISPLDMRNEAQAVDNLALYTGKAREQIELMFEDPDQQVHREKVDTIIIPVRWAGAWALYYTMRLAHTQGVIRVAKTYNRDKKDENKAMTKLDRLILEVGKGIIQQWLALLLPTIVGDSFAKEHARGKAIDDAAETEYDRRRDANFWTGDLQIGTVVMYAIHVMLATGHDSVDELADQLVHVFEMTQSGIPGSL